MCRHVGQAEGGRASVPQSAWGRDCLRSGSANRPAGRHFAPPVANVSRPTLRSLAVFWVNLWKEKREKSKEEKEKQPGRHPIHLSTLSSFC